MGRARAYYNENDPGAAAWLRELIRHGLIAPGDVDERSIEDVSPNDVLGYSQCHFFAGIGVWSYALRLSGWPDDRPVWTGSCPCQPFSAAGQGKGFADERHLWPAFFHLIEVCGPVVVFGEQVAGKDGLGWLDLVAADLEAVGYACGAVPFPAAGIGAPHIRERLYWVADRDSTGPLPGAQRGIYRVEEGAGSRYGEPERFGSACRLADRDDAGLEGRRQPGRERAAERPAGPGRMAGGLADAVDSARQPSVKRPVVGVVPAIPGAVQAPPGATSPTNGFWRDADWLGCRDGRWRPVEPGTFPLAHGAAARVGRLRGYGNAIVAPQARAFIEAYQDVTTAQWSGTAQEERL